MRIGNESLINRPTAAFIGPRHGYDSTDEHLFRAALDDWLNDGGVVMTGGALGADSIAMNHTIQWAEDHNSIELPLIIVPHDPSEGGKTTGTRAQPSHAAIDVYRPTDLPDDWRIHRITPVRPTAYGWRSYPDPWTTTDDAVPWIPLTEEDAYDLHPCHPFVQRFIDKGIEACIGDNELDAED